MFLQLPYVGDSFLFVRVVLVTITVTILPSSNDPSYPPMSRVSSRGIKDSSGGCGKQPPTLQSIISIPTSLASLSQLLTHLSIQSPSSAPFLSSHTKKPSLHPYQPLLIPVKQSTHQITKISNPSKPPSELLNTPPRCLSSALSPEPPGPPPIPQP